MNTMLTLKNSPSFISIVCLSFAAQASQSVNLCRTHMMLQNSFDRKAQIRYQSCYIHHTERIFTGHQNVFISEHRNFPCTCVCVCLTHIFYPQWLEWCFPTVFLCHSDLWTILYTPTSFMINFIMSCIPMNTPANLHYFILLFSSNYVPSDYKCTNTEVSKWMVRDSVKSFPSGHASLSTYTAIFMMVSLKILLNVLIMPKRCVFWDL